MAGWLALRQTVFHRDRGICQVCLCRVGRLWDAGHLVDRCVGGPDQLENLILSCIHCNRKVKPIHRTRDEALSWLAEQQRLAHGRPMKDDWRPFYAAMFGKENVHA